MEKCKETICRYYIGFGMCTRSSAWEHQGCCQNCGKYAPPVRTRHIKKIGMAREMRIYNELRLYNKEVL